MSAQNITQSIPFVDLQAQYHAYKTEIDAAIQQVVDSSAFIMGPQVFELEERLQQFVGAKHAISCCSGTDALLIAMMAIGVQPGDEIITTPFTFFATGETIALLGAKPVFVDIDPVTYNIDAALIESVITPKTKAIIPVSLYGQPADMDEINAIAKLHNLVVIEDAAQSFGALYKGKRSCNLSTIACTSFFPAKPLGCYGDGGAIFTSDDVLAEKICSIRNHGQSERYVHKYIGINGRMDTIQAAVLLVKLDHYEKEIAKRVAIASAYDKALEGVEGVIRPVINSDRTSVYAQYTLRVSKRAELQEFLKTRGIPTSVHYPVLLSEQEAISSLYDYPNFPEARRATAEVVSLPICGFISENSVCVICEELLCFLASFEKF